MDISPGGLARNWVPKLPALLKVAILSALGRSENSAEQDWLIEVAVNAARPILQTPASLLKSQEYFKLDPGVFGHAWIAKYTVPAPRAVHNAVIGAVSVEEAVGFAIGKLSRHDDEVNCPTQTIDKTGIETEWTSYRRDAHPWTRSPRKATSRQIYDSALLDLPLGDDSPVILYAHGGAFCLMDPANHRFSTVDLAASTNARLLSVRYRLSPQFIFPAALTDLFLCYLALLHPPPDAFHKAVSPGSIILAGDSSGGNLVTALQTLLITLAQNRIPILNPWVEGVLTIPDKPTAALSLSSPWLDITRSLPSQIYNARWDFIAPASVLSADLVSTSPLFPADEIWPAKPARTETYSEANMCAHPLVSPILTPSEILSDFPSTYICTGWEGMTDESQMFARRIYEAKRPFTRVDASNRPRLGDRSVDSGYASTAGSPRFGVADIGSAMKSTELLFEGYTAMPHTFPLIPHRASKAAKRSRTEHIKRAVADHPGESAATWTHSKTMQVEQVKFAQLGAQEDRLSGYARSEALTDEFMYRVIDYGRQFRITLEAKLREAELTRPVLAGRPGSNVSQDVVSMIWSVVLDVRDILFAVMNWLLWRRMQMST